MGIPREVVGFQVQQVPKFLVGGGEGAQFSHQGCDAPRLELLQPWGDPTSQLDLAGACRLALDFADAPFRLGLHHRHPAAIHLEVDHGDPGTQDLRHLHGFQIHPATLAPARKDHRQPRAYFLGDFLRDRLGRLFSSAVRVSSTGRNAQMCSLSSSNSRLSCRKR